MSDKRTMGITPVPTAGMVHVKVVITDAVTGELVDGYTGYYTPQDCFNIAAAWGRAALEAEEMGKRELEKMLDGN